MKELGRSLLSLVVALLLLTSMALGAFSWWGTSTGAGRARYDEMDGLYPLGAGLLAAVLLALVLGWLTVRRARLGTQVKVRRSYRDVVARFLRFL